MIRIKRLEFTKAVRLEIFRRAGGPGNLCCEGCGISLENKPFEFDHTIECWEMEDVEHGYRAPLTAEDGKLLGKSCCHKAKTARKAGERAHGRRIVEKAARVKRRSSFLTNRDGPFKKRMDGTVERRGSR